MPRPKKVENAPKYEPATGHAKRKPGSPHGSMFAANVGPSPVDAASTFISNVLNVAAQGNLTALDSELCFACLGGRKLTINVHLDSAVENASAGKSAANLDTEHPTVVDRPLRA